MVAGVVGETGLLGLVNNAGIAVGGPLEFLPIAEIRQQFEVNVIGQIAVTQAFLSLLRQGQGRIINMSSISGRVATPFLGPYAASKFALEALTDALRLELQPWGIKVISIQPGSIATPIWDKSITKGDEIVSSLATQAKTLYGSTLTLVRQALVATGRRGIPAEEVAKVVAQALLDKRPKTRYLVGRDAKQGALLAKLLPDPWRDWLILRQRTE
jgi:NAD(P)-dependent dehydrogenase (short-subunit alcohol dehydrogenase family)